MESNPLIWSHKPGISMAVRQASWMVHMIRQRRAVLLGFYLQLCFLTWIKQPVGDQRFFLMPMDVVQVPKYDGTPYSGRSGLISQPSIPGPSCSNPGVFKD